MDRRHYYPMLRKNSLESVFEVGGKPKVLDLAKMPQTLIAGTTGSGKSVTQNCILNNWIFSNDVNNLKMIMIVPKIDTDGGDMYQNFKGCANLERPIITSVGEPLEFLMTSYEAIKKVHDVMKDREAMNLRGEKWNGYFILAIDEISDLMVQSSGKDEETLEENEIKGKISRLLDLIGQKGRSSKVHLLLATQNPLAETVGRLKANINIFALKVNDSYKAKTVGFSEAQYLNGRGDGLIALESSVYRVQSPM